MQQQPGVNIDFMLSLLIFTSLFGIVGLGLITGFFISQEPLLLYVGTLFSLTWLIIIPVIGQRIRQRRVFHHGMRIVTKVDSIIPAKWESREEQEYKSGPCMIKTVWHDLSTNTIYIFKSEILFQNPAAYLQDIDGIDVYVDPHNFKKNYMDLRFLPAHFKVRRFS